MGTLIGGYSILIIAITIFAIGSFLALPWIWYHTGYISRKLTRIIELLENDVLKTGYDLRDDSVFKGLSKKEAIKKCQSNPADKRNHRQIEIIWKEVNKNVFKYSSKDTNGIDRNGVIEALDRENASKKLQEQGLIIISLEKLTEKEE